MSPVVSVSISRCVHQHAVHQHARVAPCVHQSISQVDFLRAAVTIRSAAAACIRSALALRCAAPCKAVSDHLSASFGCDAVLILNSRLVGQHMLGLGQMPSHSPPTTPCSTGRQLPPDGMPAKAHNSSWCIACEGCCACSYKPKAINPIATKIQDKTRRLHHSSQPG